MQVCGGIEINAYDRAQRVEQLELGQSMRMASLVVGMGMNDRHPIHDMDMGGQDHVCRVETEEQREKDLEKSPKLIFHTVHAAKINRRIIVRNEETLKFVNSRLVKEL